MNPFRHSSRSAGIRRLVANISLSAILCAVCAGAVADGFPAPTGIGLTAASGDQTTLYGVSTYWDSVCVCQPVAQYGLGVRIYGEIAYWRGTQRPSDHQSLWEGSVTPTLMWFGPSVGPATFFTELGVGVSGLSKVRLNVERQFATAFQFNEHFGAGLAFGEKRKYEIAAYVRHVSNGSIKQQNDGDTFFGGVLRMKFD